MTTATHTKGEAMATANTCYWKGDLARYTGNTAEAYGATFYELELLEGHRKGDRVHTQRSPNPPTRKAKP